MKPFYHSKNSAKKFGGKPADYQKIHDFFDSSKAQFADMRHRALLHSTFGIFLCEQMFGTTIKNSAGTEVCVRDIAEQHVLEDLGFIPHAGKYLKHMKLADWMVGGRRQELRIKKLVLDPSRDDEE
jgi:hypothetical protein